MDFLIIIIPNLFPFTFRLVFFVYDFLFPPFSFLASLSRDYFPHFHLLFFLINIKRGASVWQHLCIFPYTPNKRDEEKVKGEDDDFHVYICFGSAVHQKAINYAFFLCSCANFWLNNECKNPHSRVRLLSFPFFGISSDAVFRDRRNA